ncbi:MAG: NfeD family protein [Bacteroidales bacterium]|nr:NfeD family protein [Candidatus Cacconaster scatequi]
MIEWWNTLSLVMKILWGVTLASSLVFIIQSIMTFIGADADLDFDTDTSGTDLDSGAEPGTGLGLLTFRNLVNFCLGFGWTAVLLNEQIASIPLLLTIAMLVGIGLVALIMLMFKWISGMQQSGNIDVKKQAVGCTGRVYLTIPANREGEGKVQININNSVREYEAVTDGGKLPTGVQIKVVEVISESTLLVEEQESIII